MTPDFDTVLAGIALPDQEVRAQARARLDTLAKPTGALGRLEDLAVWVAGVQGRCPTEQFGDVRVVVFAGDHGVAREVDGAGVSAYPATVTALMVRTFVAGRAAVNVLAEVAGARVRVVDLGVDDDLAGLPDDVTRWKVRRGSGRIDLEDALTPAETEAAVAAGMAIADEVIDDGADLLVPGDMGIGNTTPAAALTAVLTLKDVASLVGRGTGIDDLAWMRKAAAVRDAARRARPYATDPLTLLATAGSADLAATTGFLLRAASRRVPVVLDGVASGAAALVAQRLSYVSVDWFRAGHRSTEPAHAAALERLGLTALVDQGMRLGEGTGALLAVPTVQAAAALLGRMATLDEVLAAGPA